LKQNNVFPSRKPVPQATDEELWFPPTANRFVSKNSAELLLCAVLIRLFYLMRYA